MSGPNQHDDNKYNDEKKYEVKHVYDDIHELNHPAPFWWQLIFYLSIVFGAGYYAYYELLDGPSLRSNLKAELIKIEAEQIKLRGAGPTDDELLALVKDESKRNAGREVYITKCASCHGNEGQGGIGPNLTDKYWINGNGTPRAIYAVIDKGVAERGMPPWGPILQPAELGTVTAFVKSLAGTTPANPKAPQGTEIK